MIVCVVDTIFSIMAGFLVFSCLGILANDLNTTVANLLEPSKYKLKLDEMHS